MTYEEKKSLYKSIMNDVAKSVKRQINEAGIADLSLLNKNGKANLSSNKEGKVNMPLSKENYSYKIMQIIYNVLLHNN